MSVYGWFRRPGLNGWGYNTTAARVVEGLDLSGRTYLLTGANSGLGRETMRVLCGAGARVVGAARTLDKAQRVCAEFGTLAVPLACELSEPASVRAAVGSVAEWGFPLDGIIANAGIMALPKRVVKYGIELQLLTNHFGHFILVHGLLQQLAPGARVVILSSAAHKATYPEGLRLDDIDAGRHYSPWGAYGQSKLANLLFAKALATRLPQADQTANSVHPGVIATNLGRHMNPLVRGLFSSLGPALALKSVGQGAATQCYVAAHPDTARINGAYFADCNPHETTAFGQDEELATRLWEKTKEVIVRLP